jgi:hypothetical protein
VTDAAAPDASLSFLFQWRWHFRVPSNVIYAAVVYWVFRGKSHHREGTKSADR